jgi:hypothetical protein
MISWLSANMRATDRDGRGGSTGDLIQLTDGTIINLVGVNHTVFS